MWYTFNYGGVEFVQLTRKVNAEDFDYSLIPDSEKIHTDNYKNKRYSSSPYYSQDIRITPKKHLRELLQFIAKAPYDIYDYYQNIAVDYLNPIDRCVMVYHDLRGIKLDDALRKSVIQERMEKPDYQQMFKDITWRELEHNAHNINRFLHNMERDVNSIIKNHVTDAVRTYDFGTQFTDMEKRTAELHEQYTQANQELRKLKNEAVLQFIKTETANVPSDIISEPITQLQKGSFFPFAYHTDSEQANQRKISFPSL